jgi:hypothetical protein
MSKEYKVEVLDKEKGFLIIELGALWK